MKTRFIIIEQQYSKLRWSGEPDEKNRFQDNSFLNTLKQPLRSFQQKDEIKINTYPLRSSVKPDPGESKKSYA